METDNHSDSNGIHSEIMNTAEAANYLRVSRKRLLNMVSQGLIPYSKLGRSNRYLKAELNQLLRKNQKGPNYGNSV